MIRIAAVLFSLLAFAAQPASARDYAPYPLASADGAAIREIVADQLQAFQRDDGDEAFSYASPSIKQMFGTPENFMTMVRQGYEPVYRPREVEFLDIVEYQNHPSLRVLLVGPDNVPVVAFYMMEKQSDGTWRIDGCVLARSQQQAA